MHLLVDEMLTKEQLTSPKRYIYEICEMYGWDFPESITEGPKGYKVKYFEASRAKARKRHRLIADACIRLKIVNVKNYMVPTGQYEMRNNSLEETYYVETIIPRYKD